ncbi:MAG: ornithine carbamoyltransferase [Myxococcales bacterium]|nr:ornithine carbamoyltransferase [Myxococcales bacterium]
MTRHFLNLSDLGRDGLIATLDRADRLKAQRGTTNERPLAGKSVALVFEKASTRTRLSLEVAVAELGGHPIVITSQGSQLGRGEPLKDTARVLTRMVHAVTLRTSDESRILEVMEYSTVPVLNALTDQSHPMQLLADLQTVRAHFGKLEGLTYAWIGDGNNMASSWIEAAGLLGLHLRLACPEGYDPDERFWNEARERGARLELVRSAAEAAQGAHVVSTDVFTSMGQEEESATRLRAFEGFRVDRALLQRAAKDAVVLHCLPAHRGEEIEEEVLEGPQSIVWDQAEARLHTAKAVLLWALGMDG